MSFNFEWEFEVTKLRRKTRGRGISVRRVETCGFQFPRQHGDLHISSHLGPMARWRLSSYSLPRKSVLCGDHSNWTISSTPLTFHEAITTFYLFQMTAQLIALTKSGQCASASVPRGLARPDLEMKWNSGLRNTRFHREKSDGNFRFRECCAVATESFPQTTEIETEGLIFQPVGVHLRI